MADRKGMILLSYLWYFIIIGKILCEPIPENIDELCKDDDEIKIIPYPGKLDKYILCVEREKTTRSSCINGECLKSNKRSCTNENCNDTDDISYTMAKGFCETAPILERISFFDCQNYYVCAGKGKDPITVTCPAHQHYSKYEERCTSPLEAYCLPPQYWCDNQPDDLRFAAAECFQYYECSQGKSVLESCPYNQYFDREAKQCVLGQCSDPNGRSIVRKPDCVDYEDGVFLPHQKCNQYYLCLKKKVYEGKCSPGFYFESERKLCVRDVNHTCKYNRDLYS